MKRLICLILLTCITGLHAAGLTDYFMTPPLGVGINWSHPLARGLVGCWLMNEGTGNKVEDKSGNNQIGTIEGAIWTGGKFGTCLDFDGADDYIQIPHSSIQLLVNGFTISAWITPDTAGETAGRIVDKSTSTGGATGYSFFVAPVNKVGGITAGGTLIYSAENSVIFGDGRCYHVVMVATSSAVLSFYVNGVLSGTPASSGGLSGITTTNPLRIGNYAAATTRTFNGSIGNVQIWNRALTASEVQQLYIDPFCMFRPSFDLKLYGGLPVPSAGGKTQVILMN